jgi:hypothetical protein
MDFSFNIEFAKRYGVDEAIMVKSFQFWIRLNKANKTNYHDLRYWTYNTNKSLTEYYPFWTEKQVRRIIESLVGKEILIKGNYNKIAYDRTIWYAFLNEDLYLSDNFHLEEIGDYQKVNTILPNGQMENTKQSNGILRKGEPIPVANQVLNTFTNSVNIKNLSDFTSFEKIVIDENEIDKSQKVNPFTIITHLEKERKIVAPQKERKADAEPKAERKPNLTYEAFTLFCQTFEQLSGAAYPTDQKGHYIMSPKDAGGMVYLLRWIEKVDRNNDTNEALKVFLQAAWSLPDKWLKANFTPAILYGQAGKIYTAYQTSSPAAKKKAYDDEVDRLLAEAMKKYQTQ